MPHPIIKAKIDEFEEKFTKSIPNKNGTIRNPFLMFDCDGGIVNMPYSILKSFFSTTLDAAFKAGMESMYQAGGKACKKVYQNHKEDHLCRFNDGEQNCNCYLSGINEVIVALEALK